MDFAEVLRRAIVSHIGQVCTTEPAKILAVNADKTVKVQEQIRLPVLDSEGFVDRHEDPPAYDDVPVLWFRAGSDAHYITAPLAVGDHGLLLWTTRDASQWQTTGPGLTDPGSARLHCATPWYLPGVAPETQTPLPGLTASGMVVASPTLRLGDHTASLAIAKCPPADVTYGDWFANVSSCISQLNASILALGGTPIPPLQLLALIGTVPSLATKVKAT